MVSGRRRLVSVATISALGACCLAAVGCSSTSSSGAPDPLANLTGAQVLSLANADTQAAPSVTAYATGIITSGLYVTGYLQVVPGKGCTGTLMQGPLGSVGTLTYITIGGTVYFKPDSNMWQVLAGSNASTIAQRVDGRYVKDSLADSKLRELASCRNTMISGGGAAITKGQVTTHNGVRVVPIKDSAGNVLCVTDTSKPEIVEMDAAPLPGTTDPAFETTFTVGGPVKLTPPPASQVISGASIGL